MRPVLALDVDGVLNAFNDDAGPERRRVRTAHGAKFWIDFDPAVIVALDAFIRDHDVELGWLTTWGPNTKALVEQAFDGLLGGGAVLAKMPPRVRGFRPANWKLLALRERIAMTGQPWVWVDDDAVADATIYYDLANDPVLSAVPGHPVPTVPEVGLTLAEIAGMTAFVRSL